MALAAMFSVQLGSALSLSLIDRIGAGGTAWLRLTFGALIFLIIGRPRIRLVRRVDLPKLLTLGVATGLLTVAFLAAIARIPLGTAVAIEFMGPLSVAAFQSPDRRTLVWPSTALAGVILLTRPWVGDIDGVGVLFAVIAAAGWGMYIVFTQQIGDRFSGISGLAMTIPVAALTAAVFGLPQTIGHFAPSVLIVALGLSLLLPVIPFALEMMALRQMNPTAFGTLMALEPGIGVILGLLLLDQTPDVGQWLGITLVVAAGAAASRNSKRIDHVIHTELDLLD